MTERETYAAYLQAKANLTPEQIERVEAKCQWEQCSWLYVYENWPSLFATEPESTGRGRRIRNATGDGWWSPQATGAGQ